MKKNKIGLIAFSTHSGLGNQTRRLAEFIKPDRVLVIDSSSFSKNKEQHFEWYESFQGYIAKGFPSNREVDVFLNGLTHVFVCENPLNFTLLSKAERLGIKVYIQSNYEFCDHLNNAGLVLPTQFLMPSHWKVEEMKELFGDDRVEYLPPPIHASEFVEIREFNFEKKKSNSFLHVVGTLAQSDRNGTLDVIEAVQRSERSDFSVTIHSQHELPEEYMVTDSRITYRIESFHSVGEIYKGFDALLLPRRYGGLCLPMQEALACALPVIMTDISPNNQVLPKSWLVPAVLKEYFTGRVPIEVYQCNVDRLVGIIGHFCELSQEQLDGERLSAFDLYHANYSETVLRSKYEELFL